MTGYPPAPPGPPHAWPPQQFPSPAPKKSGHGCLIAALIAGILFMGVVGLGIGAMVVLDTDPPPPPRPDSPPVTQAQTQPTPETPTDSTDPPADDPQDVLQRNAFYDVDAMVDMQCRASSQVPLDNLANLTRYYESVLPCLNRSWARTLQGSGIAFRPARLEVFSGSVSSPCGSNQWSFYCSDGDTINMYADEIVDPWNQYPGDDFSHGITRLSALHTIAHEYGHHLQSVTGIFAAMGPDWPGTELERRSELQASCLGNVWLSAQSSAYPVDPTYWDDQWEPLWRFITRVPNHGSKANQQAWTDTGFQGRRPGDCNTWVVRSKRVD